MVYGHKVKLQEYYKKREAVSGLRVLRSLGGIRQLFEKFNNNVERSQGRDQATAE